MQRALLPRTTRVLHHATRRTTAALGILLVAVAVLTACTAPAPAKIVVANPYNKPTTLSGVTNGNLPSSTLGTVQGSCKLYSKAVGSATAMILAAKKAGVTLTTRDCYRDYAGQVYWRKWWCGVGICANAAVPGTSNHGWGKALDIGTTGTMTYTSAAYKWLKANAGRFGWINPVGLNEPWHWEWVGDGGRLQGAQIHPDLFAWPMTAGVKGTNVTLLQQALTKAGFPVPATGYFGPQTESAVKAFQQKKGLVVSGQVGMPTAGALQMFS